MTSDTNHPAGGGRPSLRYQSGGAVRAGVYYVERAADEELPAALLGGEFCYVLAPRQIGKSSLRVRTTEKLRQKGVRCATVDLQRIGNNEGIKISDWYYSVLDEVKRGLGLETDLKAFWREHGQHVEEGSAEGRSTLPHCWATFLEKEVLGRSSGPVVIFVDEIDHVLSLKFSTDDFFAVIRGAHEARPDNPDHERLTFCLLGAAAPNELIRDTTRTPFNIGTPVRLEDFTWEQCGTFLSGLSAAQGDPRKLLRAVFDWTDGHPYMTQKLCEQLAKNGAHAGDSEEAVVADLVSALFLYRGRTTDHNLRYAEGRFDNIASPSTKSQLLQLYRRILDGQPIPLDAGSPAQAELKLTGLAAERRRRDGLYLLPRNRIFTTVFDAAWVAEKEGERLFHDGLTRWLEARRLGGGGEEYLLRGQALEEGLAWSRQRDDITKEEREFLLASQDQARQDAVSRTEARSARRLRVLSVALAAATLLAASLGGYAGLKAAEARANAAAVEQKNDALVKNTQELQIAKAALEESNAGLNAQKNIAVQERDKAKGIAKELKMQKEVAINARNDAEAKAEQLRLSNIAVNGARAQAVGNLKSLYLAYSNREMEINEPVKASVYYAAGYNLIGEERRRAAPAGLADAEGRHTKDSDITSGLGWTSQFLKPVIDLGDNSKAVISPDGLRMISWTNDGKVKLWNTQSGSLIKEVPHPGDIPLNPWNKDGSRWLSLTGDNGVAQMWDAEGGLVKDLPGSNLQSAWNVEWSDDGKQFRTYDTEGMILWDAKTGERRPTIPLSSMFGFTPLWGAEGKRFVNVNNDGAVELWDAQGGKLLRPLAVALSPGTGALRSVAGGKRFATVSTKGKLQLWDAWTGAAVGAELPITIDPDPSNDLSQALLAVDGARLVTSSAEGLCVWDAETGTPVGPTPLMKGPIRDIEASPDGKRLMTLSDDGVRLWNLDDGSLMLHRPGEVVTPFFGRGDHTRFLIVSQSKAHLWDAHKGVLVRTLPGVTLAPDKALENISFHGGRRLLTNSAEGLKLWDAQDGGLVQALPTVKLGHSHAVDWSDDDEWIVLEHVLGTKKTEEGKQEEVVLQLWNTQKGQLVALLPVKKGYNSISQNTFSSVPNQISWAGRRFTATTDGNSAVQLWELKTKPQQPAEMLDSVCRHAPYELENEELKPRRAGARAAWCANFNAR